jgi:hypothetical protein
MDGQKLLTLQILSQNKKLFDFEYDKSTTITKLREYISEVYQISLEEIKLVYDNKTLKDFDDEKNSTYISKKVLTNLSSLGGEKVRVRIIPQIKICEILKKIKFVPINHHSDSEAENCYDYEFNLFSSIDQFKKDVYQFFTNKLEEYNYKLDHFQSEFYTKPDNEDLFFNIEKLDIDKVNKNINKSLNFFLKNLNENKNSDKIKFYFLIKNSSVNFYSNNNSNLNKDEKIKILEFEDNNSAYSSISLRNNISDNQIFKVILQTYNSLVREIEVYPEMTIRELKQLIEQTLGIRKNYQELLYLVYKLNNENKKLKDYYIRPQGIIFLRGFYFPVIFSDFYKKNLKNILGVNIAERISNIKENLILRLGLDFTDFNLVCNGKELDDEKFLIDYNIQKMQTIYIK